MKRSAFLLAAMCLIFVANVYAAEVNIDRVIIRDMPKEKILERFGKLPGEALTTAELVAMAPSGFEGDTLKMLAILVEWSDRPSTYSRETMDSLLFSRNCWSTGSVADYVDEVSYGQVALTGDVTEWYDAGKYKPTWGSSDFIDILTVLDPVIDFTQYDGDNNGEVDAICFVRSGNGEEDSGDPDDIWSYAMSWVTGWGPYDGMMVTHWNTSPETRPLRDPDFPLEFSGIDTLNRIPVFAHELSHNMGMPDLYDYDDKLDTSTYSTPNDNNDHPLVDWCLMGYGGYGLLSMGLEIPTHQCGWNKMQAGWIEPVVLDGEYEDVVVYNIETTNYNALYKLPIDDAEGEYFLLEYRNPKSTAKFDKFDSDFSAYLWPDLTYGCDSIDRGLLITHCHDSLVPIEDWFRWNNGTPDYPHYSVIVEDAGYDPARDFTYNPEGHTTDSAQWWYPFETRRGALFSDDVDGQSEFGPNTVPNSDGYGGPSNIYVRVDSIVDDRLYMYVNTDYSGSGGCCVLRGDFNDDGFVDPLDLTRMVGFMWKYEPGPSCLEQIDVNNDGYSDPLDLTYLVNYIWKGGPAPVPCP